MRQRMEKVEEVKKIDDLRSLGIDPRRMNELNDEKELEELADNLKQSMLQDYRTAYSGTGRKHKQE